MRLAPPITNPLSLFVAQCFLAAHGHLLSHKIPARSTPIKNAIAWTSHDRASLTGMRTAEMQVPNMPPSAVSECLIANIEWRDHSIDRLVRAFLGTGDVRRLGFRVLCTKKALVVHVKRVSRSCYHGGHR